VTWVLLYAFGSHLPGWFHSTSTKLHWSSLKSSSNYTRVHWTSKKFSERDGNTHMWTKTSRIYMLKTV
jgi:hypothetical protein